MPNLVVRFAGIFKLSRTSIDEIIDSHNYRIEIEDMQRAIDYSEECTENAKRMLKINDSANKNKYSSLSELLTYIDLAKEQADRIFSIREMAALSNNKNKTHVGEVISLGIDKKWFEIVAPTGEQGSLTNEQYARFKPPSGHSSQVFKVTDLGMKAREI